MQSLLGWSKLQEVQKSPLPGHFPIHLDIPSFQRFLGNCQRFLGTPMTMFMKFLVNYWVMVSQKFLYLEIVQAFYNQKIIFLNFGTVFLTAVKLCKLRKTHCSPQLVGEDNWIVFTSHSVPFTAIRDLWSLMAGNGTSYETKTISFSSHQ